MSQEDSSARALKVSDWEEREQRLVHRELQEEEREHDGATIVLDCVDCVAYPDRWPNGYVRSPPDEMERIARKGGLAAQRSGNAHRWTTEQARAAGSKGGIAVHARRRARAAE